jgi:hypothetical protein
MKQPQSQGNLSGADSSDTILLLVDFQEGEAPPRELSPQERLERHRVVDSYSIEPEKLAQVRKAAICLGRTKAELIREGLDLVLEKYRDKLCDLPAPELPSDAPKPESEPPPA